MLMHHANSKLNCLIRFADFGRLSAPENLTSVLAIQTIQNIHQSGLAGAIFTKQRMNFSFCNGKIYMIYCPDPRELLHNPLHFKQIHGIYSLS